MRGTPYADGADLNQLGIIPAYAGNTQVAHVKSLALRDHPRVCGEHFSEQFERINKTGSSPRMRGTRMISSDFLTYLGIIPAYAGNTCWTLSTLRELQDHPRVCGEHLSRHAWSARLAGSSPRMRGTPLQYACRRIRHGIIPAYAGNTSLHDPDSKQLGDHPRVCGEHVDRQSFAVRKWGSSPRMRGTLGFHVIVFHDAGIIPAYAGNTGGTQVIIAAKGDHPRVCGEHDFWAAGVLLGWGSSPRMRGTLRLLISSTQLVGIIPAYAGNT